MSGLKEAARPTAGRTFHPTRRPAWLLLNSSRREVGDHRVQKGVVKILLVFKAIVRT